MRFYSTIETRWGIRVITKSGILYIEPSATVSRWPVVDELTKIMASALNASVSGIWRGSKFFPEDGWRGFHVCNCGARSTSYDYELPGGEVTNWLAVHYLAWHREEVEEDQLARVRALEPYVTPADPTPGQLRSPFEDRR